MRFFAILALAASVSATAMSPLVRRQAQFPSCSESCLTNADFGSCDPLDDGCLCNSSSFVNSVTTCIEGACSGSDLTNAEGAAQALCLSVGVTLTASSAAATSTSAATSGSSSGSSSASSTATTSAATTSTTAGSSGAASLSANAFAALAAVGAVALVL